MSIIEKSKIDSEIERLNCEIEEYKRLISNAKKISELSIEESKIPSRIIVLSELPSPGNTLQLSREDMKIKCRQCAGLILDYGRTIL